MAPTTGNGSGLNEVVSINDLMTDPDLFGDQFGGESWAPWRTLLAGFYGLSLDDQELQLFRRITALPEPSHELLFELWLAVGRRGGKSQIAALVAVYEAAFKDYTDRLSPGEVATVMVLAQDRKQARTVMRYVSGLLHSNPMLERLILREQQESIELTNRTIIEVQTASFRSVRGYSVACVIADEIAFWRSDESANPDTEIINALRPAMGTLNGKLIALSSPYAKRGALWEIYRRHYGKPGSVLVAQAPTLTMNPTLPGRIVAEAMERDPETARAEYLAEFRSDLETFLVREVVDAAVRSGPLELAYDRQHRYFGFADPAGGGADEFCLAIGHKEGDNTIVDLVRARRGIPAEIAAGFAELLKSYGIRKITGDRYAGSWPGDEFAKHDVKYNPSEKPKSSLYLDLLPSLNSGRVELPPDDRLLHQLIGLERRTARGGRDSIDHPRGGHDDRANVVAGLVSIAKKPAYDLELFINGRHAVNEKPNNTQRRSSVEVIRRAGIPL
jgi:hypothetical protein